jgi:uncharacterized protein YjbI with pentapeptide repeats
LKEAELIDVDAPYISFMGANLIEADLQGADLKRTDLEGTKLQRADLQGADLQGANLQTAKLQGANLIEAKLHAANLHAVENLTQEQIDAAYGNVGTKLPDHLQRPAHWSEGDEGPAPEPQEAPETASDESDKGTGGIGTGRKRMVYD